MADPDGLGPSPFYETFAALGAEANLYTRTDNRGVAVGAPCRSIRAEAEGVLRVRRVDGATVDLYFKAGERKNYQAKALVEVVSGTVLPIEVAW